jgi:hypothetical protein
MTIVEIEKDDWILAGEERYGKDRKKWSFRCPVCGFAATGEDYAAAGAGKGCVGFSCIGRWMPKCDRAFDYVRKNGEAKKGPCDYAGGGLFRLNPIHVKDGFREHEFFDFADRPLAGKETKSEGNQQ